MKKTISGLLFVGLFVGSVSTAIANELKGRIHTVHVNLATGLAHIYLEGKPSFDSGGNCAAGFWTGNSMADLNFKSYVLPLLLTAKAAEKDVLIGISGCEAGYPKIYYVDLGPRE